MRARARGLLSGAALLAALPVRPAGRPWRILMVSYRGATEVEQGFVEHFQRRGLAVEWIQRDIALDVRRLPALVQEARALRPDLVHAWGSGVTLGLAGRWDAVDPARHLTELPIVFSLVAAPVGAGIVRSLAGSGRNLTGVSHLAPLSAQLQALASATPRARPLRRLGLVYSANEPNSLAVLQQLRALCAQRGLELLALALAQDGAGRPSAEGLQQRLQRLRAAGADWLYLPPDSYLTTIARRELLPAAHRLGLASFASTEPLMAAGALLGLVGRYRSVGQFAAFKAEQILVQGRAPGSLPIESLSRFALQLRLPLARRLERLPPLALFNRAEILQEEAP